ncbi:hypothetical protein J6590_003279 [Homalodisca vitripennis]|nr:hypothetical protein J6590_003279 [Homalodisca vitripennis]
MECNCSEEITPDRVTTIHPRTCSLSDVMERGRLSKAVMLRRWEFYKRHAFGTKDLSYTAALWYGMWIIGEPERVLSTLL